MVDGIGLENRRTRKGIGGSNPSLSAIAWSSRSREARTGFVAELTENGSHWTQSTAIAWSSRSREARTRFLAELTENGSQWTRPVAKGVVNPADV